MLAVFASRAMSQQPAEPSLEERIRAAAGAVSRPLVYHVAGEDAVRVREDVQYRTEPAASADVYLPPAPAGRDRYPLVVLLHGNVPAAAPLRPKQFGIFRGWGRLLAASGFVTVVPNHRLGYPEPRLAEAADDVERAVAHFRARASDFEGDPDRLALAAFSGGGPLLSPFIREPRPYLRCLAAFYSLLDIRDAQMYRPFLDAPRRAEFSPAALLESGAGALPPTFVVRAGRDHVPGLNEAMARFLAAAVERSLPVALFVHQSGAHGFENTNDDARTREILRAALAFLETQLSRDPPGEGGRP